MSDITMNDYTMLHVLEDLSDHSVTVKADGTYTDAKGISHSLTVFDWNYFKRHVLVSFRSRLITLWDEAYIAFPDLFSSWWNSRKDLYLKQAYAYTLKYNPVENYSSREVMTDDETVTEHGLQIEHSYDDTVDLTHGLQTETTPANVDVDTTHPAEKTETTPIAKTVTKSSDGNAPSTTTHSTKGFNSTNFTEVDKDVKTGAEIESTTFANGAKETVDVTYTGTDKVATTYKNHEIVANSGHDITDHDGTITDTHSGSDTVTRNYTLTKQGNIGVMTPAEMLGKEYDGLVQDLAYRALAEFIDRYTFYREFYD